ncbi:MAG TPA: response regulator transcription factor [Chthonomonadales bacterium]|nr:response regulator transcription factor [Chthonomonadales bacterium]
MIEPVHCKTLEKPGEPAAPGPASGGAVRILLAAEHALMRAGLVALLQQLPEMEIAGQASTVREAVELARNLRPPVVLMDLTMADMDPVSAIGEIAEGLPGCRVVVLSMHDDLVHVRQALDAGAAGYLLRNSGAEELNEAIHTVLRGEPYLSKSLSGGSPSAHAGRSAADRASLASLTPRQLEIVKLVAAGRTTQQIAGDLTISTKTVETHRAQIMKRLNVHDIPALVRFAVRVGLISADL